MKTMYVLLRQGRLWAYGIAVCALVAAHLGAQTATPRISQAVNDASRVSLKGNVSALVRVSADQGVAPESTVFQHVGLLLQRSSTQDAALRQYLSELQQKTSPNYHKWLTPEQFGKLYGPADSDIAAVTSWLQSQGLTVVSVSKGRTSIEFTGTAGLLEKAFHTSIHSYLSNGNQFYANTQEPTIPAALAPVVSGIAHLSTVRPKPLYIAGNPGQINRKTGRLTPINSSTSGLRPQLSYEDSSDNYYLYVVPGDAATIYNTPNSTFNANFTGSSSYTGSGVTIGIIGDAMISTTPVVNYRSTFIGDSTAPTITNIDNVTSTTDADEAYIDTELSGGLAPKATIHYYTAKDDTLSEQIEQALADNTVDILSLSFGSCETSMTNADNTQINSWWQQAAAQGIAVTVSTGDTGSAGCDTTTDSNGNTITDASDGLAVNGLASTPYNIAVGGTDYYSLENSFSTYATVPTSASSSAGSSSTYYRTALKYIPESTWNDSTSNNTTFSLNVPLSGTYSDGTSEANIAAGSGGVSVEYSKPSWQRGTGVPSDSARDLPDVSLLAADGLNYVTWLVCTTDTDTSGDTENCGSDGYFAAYGGTSTAAPSFAGILALVQQSQGGGRLGQAAANLYNLYNNSSNASSIFHDVTVGNISVPCTSGTTDCSKNTKSYYFETGYDTTTGYDVATGLGSVNVTNLIKYWSSGMGSAAATVTVTPADTTINISNDLSVGIAVTGTSSTPSGSVTLSSGSYTSSTVSLNDDAATIVIPANSLTAGTDTLTATYSGDGIYSSTTGTTAVTVDATTVLTATTTTLAASSTTPTYGASVTLTATVSPSAAAGTVTFYDGSTSLGTGNLSSGTATYTTTALTVGTHTITASYGGNTTYAASSSSSVTVTVSSATSTGGFTLAATGVTISRGSSGDTTITVTPSGGYIGTIDFTPSTSSSASFCYSTTTAIVSGTSNVTTAMTISTNLADCSDSAAQKAHGMKLFRAATQRASLPTSRSTAEAAFSLAGLLLAGLAGWRWRQLRLLCCLVVLGLAGFALSACGGSSSSSSNYTAKGTYSITLTGADSSSSSISNTTTFTLTVD
jgi:subtilase family serine protease